jgi:hypothetical protein
VKRVDRDDAKIAELESGVIEFLEGVKNDVETLQEMARSATAPADNEA